MSDPEGRIATPPAPLGSIEPHAPLLVLPLAGQRLIKLTFVENLLSSIEGGYLHFNRVDQYTDFTLADVHDGEELPLDAPGNRWLTFEKAPEFSLSDYYARSRGRTYACCFSLENSPHIWRITASARLGARSDLKSTWTACASVSTQIWLVAAS